MMASKKVSIYCVIAFGQMFDMLYVCLHVWPNAMSCIWRYLLSHRWYFLRVHQV